MNIVKQLSNITEVIANRSEVLIIFAVIAIVFMMILPLPTALVDVLIALNISVSALMVVLVMYMPGPLAFATFPAILLITTMFRLALSITTTRLILLQGDAGKIVEAFGEFVVGGSLVVGLVIFLILTIVNFLVITKGSERVAEVAARFTLDAMPGKQMSIDGDLRAGLIDALQAQKKRADITKESQLFGAMDGAMKFVKGDAIAGIIIVFVNILGGFSIGVTQLDLPAGEAIQVYSILTVGDGLVAQIPALLISITAGLIITRVSDSAQEDINVGKQMAGELCSEPKAWIIASLVLVGFSLVPGMPFFAFIFFALVFGGAGIYQIYNRYQKVLTQVQQAQQEISNQQIAESQDDTDTKTLMPFDKLTFCVPEGTPESHYKEALRAVRRARNDVVKCKGYTIAGIEVQEVPATGKNNFSLLVHGVPKLNGGFDVYDFAVKERALSEDKKLQLISKMEESEAVLYLNSIFWIDSKSCGSSFMESTVPEAESAYDQIYNRSRRIMLEESSQFLGVEEVSAILSWLVQESPVLAEELQRSIPLPQLSQVFKALAEDEVSLRSVRKVCELALTAASRSSDISDVVDCMRSGLAEQICSEYADGNTMEVMLLDPKLEDTFRKFMRKSQVGSFIELPLEYLNKVRKAVDNLIGSNLDSDQLARPLVVSHDLRAAVRQFLKKDYSNVPVISSAELPKTLDVKAYASLSI